jgi:cytochrome oxidase Cu insertion factor (SCO1/SenC/PrrC family)
LVCAAPVVASYLSFYVFRPEGRSNYGTLIEPSRAVPPDLPLTGLDGGRVGAASLKGQWLLIVVGRGGCDKDCEQRLFMQRQLREMAGRERDRIDKLWLVTDEAPIAPGLRAALAAAPAVQVYRVPRPALTEWLAPAAGESLESHLYLVDPMGQWMMRAPPHADPSKFIRDIERLLRASASWDRPGR